MYEDYLEEFVFKTAAVITEKLFGKKRSSKNSQSNTSFSNQAIAEPQSTPTSQSNEKDDAKNAHRAKKEEKKEKEEKEKKIEVKNKEERKKDKKEVTFTCDDTKSHNEKSEQKDASTLIESVAPKSKLDLEVKEDSVVASSSQESFEMLYNQLDPDDVALFSQKDEPEEMSEEERKEVEKAEAGPLQLDC